MGQSARTGQTPRGVITIDWMVMAVAAIALLFFIGTMVRTSVELDPTADGGGLRGLGANDSLLAFQDFSFDADNWNPSVVSDDLPGLGSVLGPFDNDAVQRSFTLPANARTAVIAFDVHMIGEWSGEDHLSIALGDAETLVLRAGTSDTTPVAVQITDAEDVSVRMSYHSITPQPSETALGAVDDSFVAVRVQITLDDPGETVALRLQAQVEGGARWTLDTLSVVATTGVR